MPLSEREQRILADIEARLNAEDPRLASTVRSTTVSAHARRQLKLAAVVFGVGFLLLLGGIANVAVGIAGFGVMLAAIVHAGRNVGGLRAAPRDGDETPVGYSGRGPRDDSER